MLTKENLIEGSYFSILLCTSSTALVPISQTWLEWEIDGINIAQISNIIDGQCVDWPRVWTDHHKADMDELFVFAWKRLKYTEICWYLFSFHSTVIQLFLL